MDSSSKLVVFQKQAAYPVKLYKCKAWVAQRNKNIKGETIAKGM